MSGCSITGRNTPSGVFRTKTDARHFYDRIKLEQREQRFFPQQYKQRGMDTMADLIAAYLRTLDGGGKSPMTIIDEKRYAAWWTSRLEVISLNTLTASLVETIKRELTMKGLAPQTVLHYLKFLRHALYVVVGKSKLTSNPFDEVKMPKVRATRTRLPVAR